MNSLQEVLDRLEECRDEDYRKFNESLIPGAANTTLGVRLPQLRAIAKEIIHADWRYFLEEARQSTVYEIVLLRGLVIAEAPCEFAERLELLTGFVPSIQNWAVCDCVCSSVKSVKKHLPETFDFLQPYLRSQAEFELRFGVVMLMDYFICDAYIDQVLRILSNIRHEAYYVNMALAWALSMCFVKYRDKTLAVLESGALSPWVLNKAIQKCRESRRVSSADKEMLLKLKV